jgi:hypothetical protein
MFSVSQIARLAALAALIGSVAAAPATEVARGSSVNFSCGCDGQTDAKIEDCQKVIDSIDPNGTDATDIMKAVKNVHTGPLSQAEVMHIEGTCGYAVGTTQNINGPGGVGGGLTGTTGSNKDVKATLQTMLDGCKDTAKDKVNACASFGAGNLMLAKY